MDQTELKAGMSKTYEIGGWKLTIKPVTLGKMKRAMMAFKDSGADAFDSIANHLVEILNNGENEFANKEWIENNITMTIANQIVDDVRVINGLESRRFLTNGGTTPVTEKEVIG